MYDIKNLKYMKKIANELTMAYKTVLISALLNRMLDNVKITITLIFISIHYNTLYSTIYWENKIK